MLPLQYHKRKSQFWFVCDNLSVKRIHIGNMDLIHMLFQVIHTMKIRVMRGVNLLNWLVAKMPLLLRLHLPIELETKEEMFV